MALLHSSMFRAGKVYLVPYFSTSTFSIALLHAPHRVCSRWASGTDCYQQYVCDFKFSNMKHVCDFKFSNMNFCPMSIEQSNQSKVYIQL